MPVQERLKRIKSLSDEEAAALLYDWPFWARLNQLPPAWNWRIWLILAGRGFGKTRSGSEWVREQVRNYPMVNLVGATADDARDIMIEGESGILAICPKYERPTYRSSMRRLEWPNGARSLVFTADEPERLRGKQHMKLWCDEIGSWRYQEAWDQAMFGLRLGDNPQACVTTTPKPVKVIRELLQRSGKDVALSTGSTYENKENLAPAFFAEIIDKYEGTRLGRQELNAEILEDMPGALWNRVMLDSLRVKEAPELRRVVVAIDPAVSNTEGSDETGIIVAGVGIDGHAYVLVDRSGKYTPEGWAKEAICQYNEHGGDRIVAEVNNGGDLVENTIRMVDGNVSYRSVHASKGKFTRAEPVAALYEQGKVHHVGGFSALEDQMCAFTSDFNRKTMGYSPDRVDALVWALTELMVENKNTGLLDYYGRLAKEKDKRN